jgi:hypothetical protein
MKNKIIKLIENCNIQDIDDGMVWYSNARRFCLELSIDYNIELFKVVGVLAALSPRNKWERNLIDCENILKYEALATVATFNPNKFKAIDILSATCDKEVIKILNGMKVTSFFKNIYYVNDFAVTVDMWAMRVVGFEGNLTPKRYMIIEAAYIEAAKHYGIQPKEVQAISWVAFRNAA